MVLVPVNLVFDDLELRSRTRAVPVNVVSGLEFALEKADGRPLEGAVFVLVI
tara:strand:+ start:1745 stop:1900 length:156 start_codon:yes stop_codon:yes gene_type:complete